MAMQIGQGHDGGEQPHEHKPTEESRAKVLGLACAGLPQDEIADYFDISVQTLAKCYSTELRKKKRDRIQSISDKAYELALGGDLKMITLILTHQGNWASAKTKEDNEKDKQHLSLMEKLIDKL